MASFVRMFLLLQVVIRILYNPVTSVARGLARLSSLTVVPIDRQFYQAVLAYSTYTRTRATDAFAMTWARTRGPLPE